MIVPRVMLSELCHVVTKGTTPTSIGYDFAEEGIPFLRIQNLGNSTVSLDDVLYIDNQTHLALKRSVIKPKDFLITIAGTIGRVAIVPDDFPECNCNQAIAILRFDNEKLWPIYLLYWLTTQDAVSQIAGKKVTATISNLSLGQIKELEIPLPPLAEQKRIAAILDKADAIRRKRQQAIKLADEFLSAVFLERFGAPEHSPYGSCTLKEVTLKITDGAHFTPTYVSEGIPFLRVTDINKETVNWNNVKYIPEEEHNELIKRCKPERGDVLYSKNGTIGVPKLIDWDTEFSIFVSLCLIKPDPKKLKGKYLFSFLKTPFALKQATSKSKSATVTNLHLVEIKEIKIPLPPLHIQDEWIVFVDKFNTYRVGLMNSLEKTDALFNSLSQKAFSGSL